jgi:hypothetical protein
MKLPIFFFVILISNNSKITQINNLKRKMIVLRILFVNRLSSVSPCFQGFLKVRFKLSKGTVI